MEEKIVVKVIDIVEKALDPEEILKSLSVDLSNGKTLPHVFKFCNEQSRIDFVEMSKDVINTIHYDGYMQGVRKGINRTFGVLIIGVVVGYAGVYVIDYIKTRKTNKKSDI